ncbi:hypothetical protein J7E50_07270 [Pedobacter sp. ISL-68]|uniref:FEKKY domain-containing protein n=1 Tax=unclassified Pedobacter TaxID=2628915 RepID=UPI001BE5E7FA|nr:MULTISPECIES: hypothetical protein [unclassified Pedobacter]MBT2560631.1 hypothetical protein [Pedobacter sp. ISL-64]MBT2590010.1 hypothetical protein [Pedobacter sp. ISL-68]
MKKLIPIFMFLCFAAVQLNAKAKIAVDSAKVYSIKLANDDLKNGRVKFLIQGGFAPVYYKGQEIFEKKYNISYYEFGCVMPSDISIKHYNKVVAAFMDRKFGKDWRKEVRKDIQGI